MNKLEILSQLREFTHLNSEGIFETIPEYPEFAWYEGIVNAVTHRDYSNNGEHITIKLFDDRLEICSPDRLGGFVTLSTMRTKRYSRNPQIARVLNEMGIVRKLNEGVKRIYSEMQRFFLKLSTHREDNQCFIFRRREERKLNRFCADCLHNLKDKGLLDKKPI